MIRIKKNPTDHEFLKQIQIEKFDNDYFVRYFIWYKNICIAVFIIYHGDNFIKEVEIFDDKFKHKGLATFMYDYIEKDLKIKLRPSKFQTNDGKAFWQNRLKKSNPTDYSFLRLLKIEKRKLEFSSDNIMFVYVVFFRGKKIAYAEIFENANYIEDVQIFDEKYRRKGLATYLYNYIEHDLHKKLVPSSFLLKDGEKFWENRNKRK